MPRSCSVCHSPDLTTIDADLASGVVTLRAIARQHGVPESSLRGHREHAAPAVPVVPSGGPTFTATQAMVDALTDAGVLGEHDSAEVALAIQLAKACDERPNSPALARELRLAVASLRDRVAPEKIKNDQQARAELMLALYNNRLPGMAGKLRRELRDACVTEGLTPRQTYTVLKVAVPERSHSVTADEFEREEPGVWERADRDGTFWDA